MIYIPCRTPSHFAPSWASSSLGSLSGFVSRWTASGTAAGKIVSIGGFKLGEGSSGAGPRSGSSGLPLWRLDGVGPRPLSSHENRPGWIPKSTINVED